MQQVNTQNQAAESNSIGCFGFFSAKPKINIDINQIEREDIGDSSYQIPPPLQHGRNGQDTEYNLFNHPLYCPVNNDCEDDDLSGSYFGASIRRGPFMNKQEDRVSAETYMLRIDQF